MISIRQIGATSNITVGGSNFCLNPQTFSNVLAVTGTTTLSNVAQSGAASFSNAAGGVGIGGALNVAGTITTPGTISASNINFTGALTQNGTAFVSGGGGASTSASFIPTSHGTYDIGSSSKAFKSLYLTQGATMVSGPTTTVITPTDWSVLANYVIPTAQAQQAQTYTATTAIKLFSGLSSDHSAYVVNGAVYMFGSNTVGQLGFGNTNNAYTVPTLATSIQSKTAVSVCLGNQFTCVVFSDGTAKATGVNVSGQLGNGNVTAQTSFVSVVFPVGFLATKVVCGWDFALYMGTLNGSTVIYGFGNNSQGQLGNGNTGPTNTTAVTMTLVGMVPVTLATIVPMTIAAGGYHSMVIATDGTLYGCGWNTSGQLGMDSTLYPNKTSLLMLGTVSGSTITSIGPIIRVACGKFRTVAIKLDGTVYTVGTSTSATSSSTWSTFVAAAVGLNQGGSMDLAVGLDHAMIIQADGTLIAWGNNTSGQLGTPSVATSTASIVTIGTYGKKAVAVAAGQAHTIVVLEDNGVYSTGQNSSGQLGDPYGYTQRSYLAKIQVQASPSTYFLAKSSPASDTTAVVDTNNFVYMAGDNSVGQYGSKEFDNAYSTTLVPHVKTSEVSYNNLVVGKYGANAISSTQELFAWSSVTSEYDTGISNIKDYAQCVPNNVMANLGGFVFSSTDALYAFSSFTFTNAGATGQNGPSLAVVRSSYSATAWTSTYVNMTTNGIQQWTAPVTGMYTVTIAGAAGGSSTVTSGGYGAALTVTGSFVKGIVYNIIVGQRGVDSLSGYSAGGVIATES